MNLAVGYSGGVHEATIIRSISSLFILYPLTKDKSCTCISDEYPVNILWNGLESNEIVGMYSYSQRGAFNNFVDACRIVEISIISVESLRYLCLIT